MRRRPTFTRADRLEHLMFDEVVRLLAYELRHPEARRLRVTAVRLSPDLGHLRVLYVMEDGSEPPEAVPTMLEQASSFVSRTLVESLQLRKRPQVVFTLDREAMRMRRVDELLEADKARPAPPEIEPDDAPEPEPDPS